MSKTIVKKTKIGVYYKGEGFEFIKNKHGFYAAEMVEGVPEICELVVTPAEAKQIIKDHTANNDATIAKLEKQRDAIDDQIAKLEDDMGLDQTDSGHSVEHEEKHIKIGCNRIPFAFAKKLIS